MDPSEARQILETLANGVDPATGEAMAEQTPFNCPMVVRALFHAIRALEQREKPARHPLPGNAGKPWSKEEDASLLEAYDAGAPIKHLAQEHSRTKGAIQSRLLRHGRLQPVTADG
ncbi:hypothetical protein [Dyella flagellata]|uniref:Uncharacterized protein n=1 Tax=Dyella flagellata TaxID=1867833 RepID=A0ABQ5X649_9GAMM|nr:hypothetical protein [Dyella flagellata]GLQ86528.1 hypothetical protein GCM10007898_00940 [Dyella flagellata]